MSRNQNVYDRCADADPDPDTDAILCEAEPFEAPEQSPAKEENGTIGSNTIRQRFFTLRTSISRVSRRIFRGQSWRFGLCAGLYASVAVFVANIGILLYGRFSQLGYVDGIATIATGDANEMERISTFYHVLINVLSTILLTSSNYAMQLLSAPTRREVDFAHQRGRWMEIGLMSFHNLRQIDLKRVLLWATLAFSSVPLHLFFNAAVVTLFTGQDYRVEVANMTDAADATYGWKLLQNADWQRIYSRQYGSGFRDLRLIAHNASFEFEIDMDWKITLNTSSNGLQDCSWKPWLANSPFSEFPIQWDNLTGAVQPAKNKSNDLGLKMVINMTTLSVSNRTESDLIYPTINWPSFPVVITNDSVQRFPEGARLCPGSSWLQGYPLQIHHAFAEPVEFNTRVQIALPFIIIVIVANALKSAAIFATIKTCSSDQIITIGDAVSSFLEHPEPSSSGKCTLSKNKFLQLKRNKQTKPQPFHETRFMLAEKHGAITIALLCVMGVIMVVVLFTYKGLSNYSAWGTASALIIPATKSSFDTKGILKTAWYANLPQILLSLVYFTINRICTSMCSSREWNNYALHRKGLRVTSARGLQRSTHFLQLPYRWAIPLTVTSGLLHWLLSQSLFLVRMDRRDRDGVRYPTSTSACGYSPLSLLCFTCVFLTFMGVILCLALRSSTRMRIPPARNCSTVISAACHPPSDDHDAHLKKVQWGVVDNTFGAGVGHCTFTSRDVSPPRGGILYA